MNTSHDHLFTLIKSLSKAEKRYFKLHAGKQDGQKDYIDLFDAIDNQKEYNEEKLKANLKNKELLKSYAVIKNYLFNAIIDSLHEHSSYETAEYKLEELIKKIKVLYEKGLIEACLKYIEKAKKIGYENECYTEMIKLLSIQHQISRRNSSQLFKKRREIQQELDEAVEKSYNLSQYLKLELHVNDYLYTQNLAPDSQELTSFLLQPLLVKRELALSNKALAIFLKIQAKLCEYKGQKQEALHYTHEILKNLEAGLHSPFENPIVYARTINTYLQATIDMRQFDQFEHYLSILQKLLSLKISPEHLNTIKGFYYVNLIHRYIVYGRFDKVLETIENKKEEIIAHQLIPLKFRIFIQYFECVAFIGNQHYKPALKILHTTLGGNENILLPLKRISRILSMIVQFELNNISMLMNELESTTKYIHNLEHNLGEKIIIKHLKLVLNCSDKKERADCFKKFKSDLIELEKNAKEALSISYFDFLSWCESKIENTSFEEIVIKKASAYSLLK